MFLAIIAILLTLILVVGVHEGGHAWVARLFRVHIKKVSIGFGKPLLRWRTRSGCEWIWALFPLGGYAQLENTRISPVTSKEYAQCFDKKPIWQRLLILLAGITANLIFAWLAFVAVYRIGLNYKHPEIKTVVPQSMAAQAGILPGDRITSIGGYATPSWGDVGMRLVMLWGKKELPVTVLRAHGKEEQVLFDLNRVQFHGLKSSLLVQLGMNPNLSAVESTLKAPSVWGAIKQTNHHIGAMIYFFLMVLKHLVTGVIPFSVLLGPIGLFANSIASLMQGGVAFLFFLATFSVAVALINLFPVPGLDGGSIVYVLIEKISGKPISIAMELLLHRLAVIGFCVLLVQLLMNDLQKM